MSTITLIRNTMSIIMEIPLSSWKLPDTIKEFLKDENIKNDVATYVASKIFKNKIQYVLNHTEPDKYIVMLELNDQYNRLSKTNRFVVVSIQDDEITQDKFIQYVNEYMRL